MASNELFKPTRPPSSYSLMLHCGMDLTDYMHCTMCCEWCVFGAPKDRNQGVFVMYQAIETAQKTAKEGLDLVMKNVGTASTGVQAIAKESTDFAKSAFDHSTSAFTEISGTKSVEKALELQTAYAKSAYEGFVAYATKIGTMYTDLAKETMKPLEGIMVKTSR